MQKEASFYPRIRLLFAETVTLKNIDANALVIFRRVDPSMAHAPTAGCGYKSAIPRSPIKVPLKGS